MKAPIPACRPRFSQRIWARSLLLSFVIGTGCQNQIGGGFDEGEGETPSDQGESRDQQQNPDSTGVSTTALTCTSDRNVAATEMQRLTRYEYMNTLSDLLGADVVDALQNALKVLPLDRDSKALDRLSQNVSATHVQAYFSIAEAIGDYYADRVNARRALRPCLGDTEPPADCIRDFILEFGPQAYRRPLETSDTDRLQAAYDAGREEDHPTGVAHLLVTAFSSPYFIFKIEMGRETLSADGVDLTSMELANRLAYFAWGRPPDVMLRNAATDGVLDSDQGVTNEIERLFAHPHARAHMKHFFHQWLGLDRLPSVEGAPSHIASQEEVQGLNQAMEEEMERLVEYIVWEQEGTFSDLMTTHISFVTSPQLASVYQVQPFESETDPVELDSERRSGILTRLAFLAHSSGMSSPIQRGVKVRVQFLCDDLKLPVDLPVEAFDPPPFNPEDTTRDRVTLQTDKPSCMSCHSSINPAGFAFEAFDGLGRHRDYEKIFDTEGNQILDAEGNPILLTVDAKIDTQGELSPDVIDGAVAFSEVLAQSEAAGRCFSTHWYEFNMARKHRSEDACGIQALTQTLIDDRGSILDVLRQYAQLPEFRRLRRNEL